MKGRFPRRESRSYIRGIFETHGGIPDEIFNDRDVFTSFNLTLPEKMPGQANQFNRLNYGTLDEYKAQLDLRPLRNVIVKQNAPENDDSSIYEIFSRLNSGGVNLRPQEIRASLYHSQFLITLNQLNARKRWRSLLGSEYPDQRMKDVEILLRMFALLVDHDNYAPSMIRFLNAFAKKSQNTSPDDNEFLVEIFDGFLESTSDLPEDIFMNVRSGRFNVALVESVFAATCAECFQRRTRPDGRLSKDEISSLSDNEDFVRATQVGSTSSANVHARLELARSTISSLS